MRHSVDEVLVAGLRLRFGRDMVAAHVYLPPDGVGRAAVALLLADEATPDRADPFGPGLSAFADLLVLRVQAGAQLLATLRWLADHAHELGGRPDRLMVAGRALSGGHAARLAIAARDNGWPVLHRQVLVHPRFSQDCGPPRRLAGVAPATIVCGGDPHDEAAQYVHALKRSGVEVCQLRPSNPDDEIRMLADLGRALQGTKGRAR